MLFCSSATGIPLTLLALAAAMSGCTPDITTPSADAFSSSSVGSSDYAPDAVSGSIPSSSLADGNLTDATAAQAPAASSVEIGLTVADLEQLEQVVQSHAGKVVVVDVWSTSCAPCMREFPHLVALSQTHPEQLVCISLNVDYIGLQRKPPEAYLAKVEQFLQKQQAVDITNLLSASPDETVLGQFSIGAIPAILIYAPGGELKHTLTDSNTGKDGLTYQGDVLPKVRELLPQL